MGNMPMDLLLSAAGLLVSILSLGLLLWFLNRTRRRGLDNGEAVKSTPIQRVLRGREVGSGDV